MAHAARLRLAQRRDLVAGEREIGEAGDPRAAVEAVAERRGEHVDDAAIAAVAVDDDDAAEAVVRRRSPTMSSTTAIIVSAVSVTVPGKRM